MRMVLEAEVLAVQGIGVGGVRLGCLFVFLSPPNGLELHGTEATAHEEKVPLTGGAVGLHHGAYAIPTRNTPKPRTTSICHRDGFPISVGYPLNQTHRPGLQVVGLQVSVEEVASLTPQTGQAQLVSHKLQHDLSLLVLLPPLTLNMWNPFPKREP